jgi:hypothetical protein
MSQRQVINVKGLLAKKLSLSEDMEDNGFEIVKTKSSIKIQLNGKTVVNLKASDLIEYTIFTGFSFTREDYELFDDEDNSNFDEENADLLKHYVIVQSGYGLYFDIEG